jgi:hypothetical protein
MRFFNSSRRFLNRSFTADFVPANRTEIIALTHKKVKSFWRLPGFLETVVEKKLIINSTLDSEVDRDREHPENREQLNAFYRVIIDASLNCTQSALMPTISV